MDEKEKKFILKYLRENQREIEKALKKYLPGINSSGIISQAIHYSVFSGGKRIRPILSIATGETLGKTREDVLPSACAIELIHTQSLIHDDLPCMDNDDFRRGKPALHKVFGEANALLSADTLIFLSFKIIVEKQLPILKENEDKKLKKISLIIKELADLAGLKGLIKGQALDLQKEKLFENRKEKYILLKNIYLHKTSALFEAAVKIPAILFDANYLETDSLIKYAKYLGLAFQIKDDLDEKKNEINSVSILGREKTEELLKLWTEKSIESLKIFEGKNNILKLIAKYLLEREN